MVSLPRTMIILQIADKSLVDRAFVHMDYAEYNFPSHMQQDS